MRMNARVPLEERERDRFRFFQSRAAEHSAYQNELKWTTSLSRLIATRRIGNEPFHEEGQPLGYSLLEFWRWSASDLVSNATRGILAEFLVAKALGGPVTLVREEWAAFDLLFENIRIEVKSAAYLQAWHQLQFSKIQFSTRLTRAWDAETNLMSDELQRQADVYVFAQSWPRRLRQLRRLG